MSRIILALCCCLQVALCCDGQATNLPVKADMYMDKNHTSTVSKRLVITRDSLNLDVLENGYDSLQIRIWITKSREDSFKVVVLRKKHTEWEGILYNCKQFLNLTRDTLINYAKDSILIVPVSGWNYFINGLKVNNIMTMPDFRTIKDYPIQSIGGSNFIVEISTKKIYRLYMFDSPTRNKNSFKEAKNMVKIMSILSRELKIQFEDL